VDAFANVAVIWFGCDLPLLVRRVEVCYHDDVAVRLQNVEALKRKL
jgi:hypothetical protein